MLWLAASTVASVPSAQSHGNPPPAVHRGVCPYSVEAAKERVEGTVRIRVLVTTEGTVAKVNVVNSSGNDALDDSAVTCAKKWRFKPALLNGKVIAAWTAFDLNFHLNPAAPTPSSDPNPGNL